jgi:hypothetical protein
MAGDAGSGNRQQPPPASPLDAARLPIDDGFDPAGFGELDEFDLCAGAFGVTGDRPAPVSTETMRPVHRDSGEPGRNMPPAAATPVTPGAGSGSAATNHFIKPRPLPLRRPRAVPRG